MTRKKMISEILKNQDRTNEHVFTQEKLEQLKSEELAIVCEASKHLRTK